MTREELAAIVGFPPSDEQWAAISAPLDDPMLVLAGAGSGKTAVMSARVLWAVGTGEVLPEQVLGLTFTNKAAGELSSRVRQLLAALPASEEAGEPVIQTYHAFAMDLIVQYGLLVGAEPSAALLSPTDLAQATYRSVTASRQACEDLGTGVINTVRQRVQSLDEQLSEHLCPPQRLREFDRRLVSALAGEKGKPAQEAALAARRRLLVSEVVQEARGDRAAQATVSFADLMRLAVEVTAIPEVVSGLRERFALVLVDEYQDTSVAQARLLQQLFGAGHPLTAVGDPLQAIYGWRGASVANIDGFPRDFGAGVRPLTINRRSGSLILDVANSVAAPVRSQHPGVGVLRPGGSQTGHVTASLFTSFEQEMQWVIAGIRDQLATGRDPDRIAILCRTNSYIQAFAEGLRAAGIPVAAASLGSVLNLPEVVEVLSVLRVAQSGDNAALVRLLTGPQWRIGDRDLAVLGARAQSFVDGDEAGVDLRQRARQAVGQVDPVDVVSLLEAVYDPGPLISSEATQRLAGFTRQLDAVRPALAAGIEEAAHRIVDVTGLSVEVRLGPQAMSRMDGLATLFDVIATYRSAHDDTSVSAFLQWLDFAEQLDETPDADFPIRGHAVQVMSVHRSKGLEWECVFVPALSEGIFPSKQGRYLWTTHYEELPYPLRGDCSRLPHLAGWTAAGGSFPDGFGKAAKRLKEDYKEQDAFEENRLAYVAATRARDDLFVSGHWYSQEGQTRSPSAYLLAAAAVEGVEVAHWVAEQPDPPAAAVAAELDWPGRDEVFTDTAAPVPTFEPLTLEESAWLARIDADIDAVYAREVELSRPTSSVAMPPVISTSLLMRAAADADGLARDLARPMPRVTSGAAQRGTAFHQWVAATHHQLSLIPEWDLAADADLAPGDDDLAAFIAGYRRTPFAQRIPYAVETEVALTVAGTVVRGVIDAVYRNEDGTWEVVDWKTSRAHSADPLQLAVYRIAWAHKQGVDPREVTASFVYVADGEVVRPDLPSLSELAARLEGYRENSAVTAQ